jgi:DnaK suppressor protein
VKAQPRKTKLQAPTPKPKAKPAAKKAAAKPAAAKSAAKTAAKAVTKAPAKKPAVKTGKPASSAASKAKGPSSKDKRIQPAARPVAKTAKPAPKVPVKAPPKAAAQPVPKTRPQPAAKPAAKDSMPQIKPVPAPAPIVAAPAPKTRSARSNQLTAPSMAPAVASTAAKASYTTSSMSQAVIPSPLVPPPQLVVKKDPKLANNWKTKTAAQLSDAEVMAMPDAEYMNDQQMAFFRLKLVQLKQDILNSADETTEHLREETVIVPDPADRATIEEEHALELRTRDRERKLLKKIEQSIARIDAGDYGFCDETGEPIGVGRLLARPTATLSLEAQQRRELKQKMFGD